MGKVSREDLDKIIQIVKYNQSDRDAAVRILAILGLELAEEPILPRVTQGEWRYESTGQIWTDVDGVDKVLCRNIYDGDNGVLMAMSKEIVEATVRYLRAVQAQLHCGEGVELMRLLTDAGVTDWRNE